jgi:hypothetical protein
VHVGAIVTIPHSSPSAGKFCGGGHLSAVASWDVLGASPLSRTLERFRISGVSEISILREDGTSAQPDSGLGFIDCVPAWDSVVSRYLGYGLKTLLLIRIGPYVELDVTDFLRFHRETSSPVAQVYDQHGALDLFAIDAAHLRDKAGPFRGTLKSQTRYPFVGYTNRLQDVHDFRQLVKDALFGRAAIRPIGRELAANVWVNQDARVDESTRIFGPAYIGRNSRVQADSTIIGASSIEQECEIDCGTTVDDCCILSGTYLGMGLTVRHAVASEHTLLHLGRNVELRFHDRRLMGALRSEARWQVRPSLSAPVPASLDPCSQPTNPNWHL